MAGPSFDLKLFLESFHASRADRRFADDFHLAALARLTGLERERAERLLLARLRSDEIDGRIAPALAVLESKAAVEPLREALERATGHARVRIAAALVQLDTSFDPSEVFTDALENGDFVTRSAAIRELSASTPEVAREPLLGAMSDADFSVRINAFSALLRLYDIEKLAEPQLSPLKSISTRLLARLDAVWMGAAQEMYEILAQLDAGKRPAELGLTDLPTESAEDIQKVFDSMAAGRAEPPWNEDLDLDALTRLEGAGRQVVESAMLSRLHQGDPRIPRALAAMRSENAEGPLREAVGGLKGEAKAEAEKALRVISGELGAES